MEEACADARGHMCDCVPIPPRHLLQGSPNYSIKSDRNPNPVKQRWRRIPTRVYIESAAASASKRRMWLRTVASSRRTTSWWATPPRGGRRSVSRAEERFNP
jgi:hypothetical protein